MVWQEQKPVLIWVSWGDPADLWPPPFPHVILFDMVKVFQITGMVFWLCQCMEFSGKNQTPFIVQFPDAPDPMLFHESLELAPVNAAGSCVLFDLLPQLLLFLFCFSAFLLCILTQPCLL